LLNLDKVIRVVVHKYDFSLRMWEKVESINDKVFFISVSDPKSYYVGLRLHFICQVMNSESEGGRIYIALKDNNFVYIYNIEDNSLMISPHFSNLPKSRSCLLWYMLEPTCVRYVISFFHFIYKSMQALLFCMSFIKFNNFNNARVCVLLNMEVNRYTQKRSN
jgi:hypothetical protein